MQLTHPVTVNSTSVPAVMTCAAFLLLTTRARSCPPKACGAAAVSVQQHVARSRATRRVDKRQLGPHALTRHGGVKHIEHEQADMVRAHHVHAADCAAPRQAGVSSRQEGFAAATEPG